MNSFCEYCTGHNKREIKECDDRYCPFHPFRFADMDWQIKKQEQKRNEKSQNTHI